MRRPSTVPPVTVTPDLDLSGYPPPQVSGPKKRRRWLVLSIVGAAVFVLVVIPIILRVFVFQTFYIPPGSMTPTLQVGDRIVVDKLSYDFGDVHQGDIVVFTPPPAENCGGTEANDLVKRVIGLPGDTIALKRGYVYVNRRKLVEQWLPSDQNGTTVPGPPGTPYNLHHPYVVPPGGLYVLGDNRTESCDSRYWGTITKSEIVGKVVVRVWPTNRFHIF
jgi:signal peptidase I